MRLILLFSLLSSFCNAQITGYGVDSKIDTVPNVIYYNFYNGVQMIKIDHVAVWNRKMKVSFSTYDHTMSSLWQPDLDYPINEYIFRDINGKIIRQVNTRRTYNSREFRIVDTSRTVFHSDIAKDNSGSFFTKEYLNPYLSSTAMGHYRPDLAELKGNYYPVYTSDYDYRISRKLGVIILNKMAVKQGLMDSLGNIVLDTIYDGIGYDGKNYIVNNGGKVGLFNHELEQTVGFKYRYIQNIRSNQYVIVNGSNLYGLINDKDETLSPCKYERISRFYNNTYKVKLNSFEGLLDSIGNELIKPNEFKSLYSFDKKTGLITARNKKGYHQVNFNGKKILSPKDYDEFHHWSEGLVNVRKGDTWYYIDTLGNKVLELDYKYCHGFYEGISRVGIQTDSLNNNVIKYGFINKKGELIIPVIYTWASVFKNGKVAVSFGDKKFFIDKNGNRVKGEVTRLD